MFQLRIFFDRLCIFHTEPRRCGEPFRLSSIVVFNESIMINVCEGVIYNDPTSLEYFEGSSHYKVFEGYSNKEPIFECNTMEEMVEHIKDMMFLQELAK